MAATLNPKVRHWVDLGKKRLQSVLGLHTIANNRTIENKISDGGPSHMRVQPQPLTTARTELEREGRIRFIEHAGAHWYYLDDADPDKVQLRLQEQAKVHQQMNAGNASMLIGQALEIAVFRSLNAQTELQVYGGFHDLDEHDDSSPYRKEEPPSLVSGLKIPGEKKLDFLLHHPDAGHVGVEVKNVRQWLYPDHLEVREFIHKCCAIDAVPVIIARRIAYVTFSEVFRPCGVLHHETYNQRLPKSYEEIANKAKDKRLLGYHDIRLGNEPDTRLNRFLHDTLPPLLSAAREKFNEHRDLLEALGDGSLTYRDFHIELRQKWGVYGAEVGENEDEHDPEELQEYFDDPALYEPTDEPDYDPGDDEH